MKSNQEVKNFFNEKIKMAEKYTHIKYIYSPQSKNSWMQIVSFNSVPSFTIDQNNLASFQLSFS